MFNGLIKSVAENEGKNFLRIEAEYGLGVGNDDTLMIHHDYELFYEIGNKVIDYIESNKAEVYNKLGMSLDAKIDDNPNFYGTLNISEKGNPFFVRKSCSLNDDNISALIPTNIKREILFSSKEKMRDIIIADCKAKSFIGRNNPLILVYVSLFGIDTTLTPSLYNLDFLKDGSLNNDNDNIFLILRWYYLVSGDDRFKEYFNVAKKAKIREYKDKLNYFNSERVAYKALMEVIHKFCITMKIIYFTKDFDKEINTNSEKPLAKDYMNDNFKIIKEFIYSFKKSKRRIYEELINSFASDEDEDLKNYLFEKLKSDELFGQMLIKHMLKD